MTETKSDEPVVTREHRELAYETIHGKAREKAGEEFKCWFAGGPALGEHTASTARAFAERDATHRTEAQDIINRLTQYRDMARDAAPKQALPQDTGYFQGKVDAFDVAIAAVSSLLPRTE